MKENQQSPEEIELQDAIEAVLKSLSPKKLVIAGPGTGKTTLFKKILNTQPGNPDQRIVLTFINNLRNDLEEELSELAKVYTLHSYSLGLLYKNSKARSGLSSEFRCLPGLAKVIGQDWELINGTESPKFISEMRDLLDDNNIPFYINRGNYYDAVDFDDTVYRVHNSYQSGIIEPKIYNLILIDEYQDFNKLEAGLINELSKKNSILIAGDDDQALYSQLRNASWDHIRLLNTSEDFEVFTLPFCLRCPKVIVEAVNDLIEKAREIKLLKGRINKPYKHFPLVKGNDSLKYPKIINVQTSVQRQSANYIAQYIEQAVRDIEQDEINKAKEDGFPAALVIVANPYRDQIYSYFENKGYPIVGKSIGDERLKREIGLSILKNDPNSNLGWRIILNSDSPSFLKEVISLSADFNTPLVQLIPKEFVDNVLSELEFFDEAETVAEESEIPDEKFPPIRVTSFEGAKGLSAQHVFIVGLHNGELPHNVNEIADLEICKFIVGITRTRKSCTLIHTRNFAGSWKDPSVFISWINSDRLKNIIINASYWKK